MGDTSAADMELEQLEEEDIMDFLQSKGTALDAFRKEFTELQKACDMTLAINTGKEREVDVLNQEYKSLRDQLFFTKRNIDELVSQQEVLKEKVDTIHLTKETLIEREASNRDEIAQYSGYFAELKEALSVGASWSPEQLEQRIILEKEREFAFSKYENKLGLLMGLRSDIDHSYQLIQQLEEKYNVLDAKNTALDKRRHDNKKDTDKLLHKKEATEKKIHDLRAKLVEGEEDIIERRKTNNAEDKSLKDLDLSIAKSKNRMEEYISDYANLFRTLTDLTSELEKENSQNRKIEEEIVQRKEELDLKAADVKKAKKELEKLNQLRDLTKKKCQEAEDERQATMQKVDKLTEKVQSIRDNDLVAARKEIEAAEKLASSARQELEIVRKKNLSSEKTATAMADLIQLNKNGKINLTLEIKLLTDEAQYQKNQIRQLLMEKEKFEHDAEVANQQYYTALEELKLQELQAQELSKKIAADKSKLKQKQTLYESVRSDRNLYSKQLVDSQEEINALKRQFRSMNHSIDQMKEEISVKDHAIVKEHFQHHSVDKDKEILKNEITKIKKQLNSSNVIMENQRVEIVKLQRIIEEADAESTRQKNELSAVASERSLLTGQLVKRNFELNEMYGQIKVQRSNLRIGESNYNKYLENLAQWQRQVVDVVNDHNATITGLAKLEEFRFRVVQMEREILKEKTRSRALADELEVPMNVHRWRILESSDPKRYEKVLQVQQLQKQLIEFSDKVTQIDLLIQEKEKIYVELKSVIARQPGLEVEEQLLVYQQTLKDKVKQLSAMDQELAMYIEQVSKFKEEIASIDADMNKMGKKWMKTMRTKSLKAT